MTVTRLPGPPPGRGSWWISIKGSWDTLVMAVAVEPALIHRDNPVAPLLIKTLSGCAYDFATMRASIDFHAPLVMPEAP